jgi:16S rRNA (uracil1498-N3)-methyltransferase
MIRLYVTHPLLADAAFPLDDGQSRYLTQVMRKAVGDEVLVFNGSDGEWRCAIDQIGKRFVILKAKGLERPQGIKPDLVLLIAVVKRGRMETIVEKAAELGASAVWPVLSERTNAERLRLDRLSVIATEAAEQTGRLDVPDIREPAKLEGLLTGWDPARRLLFCDEAGDAKPISQALSGLASGPWAILIGPEGGFSPAERARLRGLDFTIPASLGPRILRADTAAISAMTLWQSIIGDWTS